MVARALSIDRGMLSYRVLLPALPSWRASSMVRVKSGARSPVRWLTMVTTTLSAVSTGVATVQPCRAGHDPPDLRHREHLAFDDREVAEVDDGVEAGDGGGPGGHNHLTPADLAGFFVSKQVGDEGGGIVEDVECPQCLAVALGVHLEGGHDAALGGMAGVSAKIRSTSPRRNRRCPPGVRAAVGRVPSRAQRPDGLPTDPVGLGDLVGGQKVIGCFHCASVANATNGVKYLRTTCR